MMTHLPDPDRQPQFYDSVPAKRLFAWVVDSILIFAACAVVVVLTAFVGLLIWPLLYLVIGFLYRTATLASGSATWGMALAGIEFRNAAGDRLDGGQALWHTAGYTFSMAFPVLQVISVALMLTSPRAQGLTDHAMGTVALNRRAAAFR